MFNVAYASQWQGMNIDAKLVNSQLERLRYGISALEMLMDKNALKISVIGIEDLGSSGFIGKDVIYSRLKLSFAMEAKDLVTMLEDLRQADTYYSVEGMRIAHPYILARYEPQLQVDMYLIRAKEKEGIESASTPETSAEAGYAGNFGDTGLAATPPDAESERGVASTPEPGTFGKAWKWFKRNVLYTNS